MRYLVIVLLSLVGLLGLYGCVPPGATLIAETSEDSDPPDVTPGIKEPTQLATRQIEVRTLDVPYDVAYRSATQAFFSLGYSIKHSDKASGILSGTRMTGVKEAKQDRQNKATLGALGMVPYIGIIAALGALAPSREPTALEVTMFLQPLGQNQTQIRIKMQKNGEPVWDQTTISRLWVATQREAMIESGPPPANQATPTTAPAQKASQPVQKKNE